MSYKYGRDYDDIIDIKAEMDFIRSFLNTKISNDFNVLEEQMIKLYELECNEHKFSIMKDRGKIWYGEEYHLSYRIKDRNNTIIYKIVLEYVLEHYPKVKEMLGSDYDRILKKYDDSILTKTIEILEVCIWIFNAKGNNIIYNKERNVELYKSLLIELSNYRLNEEERNKQIKIEL